MTPAPTPSATQKEVVAMRGKLWFLAGLATGYVLGTRAGREKYEELARTARKIKESPTVQEAAGVVQEQANRLYTEGKNSVANSRLGGTRIGQRLFAETRTGQNADPAVSEERWADPLATSGTNRIGTEGTSPGL
jgi:hypothetical protein